MTFQKYQLKISERSEHMISKNTIKLFVITMLFLIFLLLFGIPSVNKYIKNESLEVVSVDSESSYKPILAPSIVICPTNPNTSIGWKIEKKILDSLTILDSLQFYKFICGSVENLPDCILDKSYSLEESIFRFTSAGSRFKEFPSLGHFTTDITLPLHGQCHKIESNATILPGGRSLEEGFLTLTLNSSLNFMIRLILRKITNKYGSVQELRSIFSHIKSIYLDFSLVWFECGLVSSYVG